MGNVIVLGCGPAGLAVAHAYTVAGHAIQVISNKARSPIAGTQYLSAPIKGVTPENPVAIVEYITRGTHQQYRDKVYTKVKNDAVLGPVSPAALPQEQPAWDMRVAYDHLWRMYEEDILDMPIRGSVVAEMRSSPAFRGANLVVSTIPAPALCINPQHYFYSQPVYIAPGYMGSIPDNTVICNGESTPSWYRTSRVFGHGYTEWPDRKKPPVTAVRRVEKPIATNCDCWQNVNQPINRVGRFGAWKKGILIGDVYNEAVESAEALWAS